MMSKKDEKMIRRNISIPKSLWAEAAEKAGLISLSAVIRRLLEKWLKGEVSID